MTESNEISQRRTRLLARLADRKGRRREALVVVEGVRAVGEALDAQPTIRFVLVSPRLEGLDGGRELIERLDGLPVDRCSDGALGRVGSVGTSQGVLLVCEEPSVSDSPLGSGRYLVLDAVQDPGNVGTLVRAAVAFGIDGVVALDGTADLWNAKSVRASAGLMFRLPVRRMDAARAVGELSAAGVPILAAAADGDDVRSIGAPASFALVVGNEGNGVRPPLRDTAERTVSVRMRGDAESLNVGMAGAILLHELNREDHR